MRVSSPETPLQSRAGKTETPSMSHTSSKASSATKPIIPLSSPLWSLSTPLETLQSRSIQRGSAAAPLPSSSHAHQAASVTNIGHNTAWMSPLPYPNPWLASPQTSGFDVGSRFPVFPITESVKLTPTKESSLPYSGGKHVLSGTSGNIFKGTQTLEPASTVVAPAQHSTGTKSRKRKKMPVSVESDPSILNSLQQTEVVVSPLVSISTPVPITAAPGSLTSNAGTLPSVDSISAVPMNLVSTFPGKKMKSSLQSPIFGGNLVSEVKQRSVLPADTIDKLNEAKMHAEDASALATAAVSHSEYVWKQIEQQRHAGLQPETQGRLASAAVAVAAAAAVAKAAAAAANVAANAAFQAKLMAEEASLPSVSYQGNELHKSNDVLTQGQGTPASVLKGEGAVV
ncbi:PREDICTED: flocculation protein FLO11-like, partial [Brassica oleracea var. oleracea]